MKKADAYYYRCDKCRTALSRLGFTVERALHYALSDGWLIGRRHHYCPKCQD